MRVCDNVRELLFLVLRAWSLPNRSQCHVRVLTHMPRTIICTIFYQAPYDTTARHAPVSLVGSTPKSSTLLLEKLLSFA